MLSSVEFIKTRSGFLESLSIEHGIDEAAREYLDALKEIRVSEISEARRRGSSAPPSDCRTALRKHIVSYSARAFCDCRVRPGRLILPRTLAQCRPFWGRPAVCPLSEITPPPPLNPELARERAIIIESTMSAPPRSATASRLRPIAMGYFEFWRFQLTLLAIGFAVVGIFWLFQGHVAFQDIVGPVIFTFIVGNCTYFSALAAVPIYAGRSFPWDVFLLLAILIPASVVGGYLASIVTRFALQQGDENLLRSRGNLHAP